MPIEDITVTVDVQPARYTFDSETGELALLWGEFNSYFRWGDEVPADEVTSVTATNEVSFTGDCSMLFDQTGGTNGKEWKNWKKEGGDGYHFNLESGKGYLYANSGNVKLTFAGTPYNGDGVVNLTYSTTNPDATMHGWNLIGNPFSTNATIGDTPFYRMNA